MDVLHGLRRTLRSRSIIVAELLAVAAAGVTLTVVPQVGGQATASSPLPPPWAFMASALALDHVLQSAWFGALVALCSVTLALVLTDQWRRAVRVWNEPLTPSHFHGAPFNRRFARAGATPGTQVRVTGNVGILGAPVFHSGLMCVMVAGLLRVLFGQDAQVDLMEGETLAPQPDAYPAQWGGILATPFALTVPLHLLSLEERRYKGNGNLESFGATVTLDADPTPITVAVNTPLDVGFERIYLTSLHGPAVLLEYNGPSGVERTAVFLKDEDEAWIYQGKATLQSGLDLRLRVNRKEASDNSNMELRVLREGGLLASGNAVVGQPLMIAPGEFLIVHGLPQWARFSGARDVGWWLAYLGFALAILGALLMFGVTRVDTLVHVTKEADGEMVWLAMKPHRFAPLYAERFDALLLEQGAPVEKTTP